VYNRFPEFNRIGRILTERYYYLADKRAKELRAYNATEKYRVFNERHLGLANRVPLKYIASYLGIEKETLYRIKNGNYYTYKKP
jgi:hypothetical protein